MSKGLNRLRIEYRVLILAVLLSGLIWLVDAILDYFFFFEASWAELLFSNVSSHELYMRTVPIVVLLVFGLAISVLLARQKRIELDLRAREKDSSYLAALVASSDDAIIGKTLDGAILSWNEGAERIYGYSAAEAVGQSVAILLPPDRADELAILLDKIKQGESVEHFQTNRLTKDGRRLVMSLTISPIRDTAGQIVGASTIARDITQQIEVEESVAQLATRLMLINDIEHDIAAELELSGVLNKTVRLVRQTFNYDHVAIFLIKAQRLKLEAIAGLYTPHFPPGHTQLLTEGINGWVASHGQQIIAQDVALEPRYVSAVGEDAVTRSELCLPIKFAEETVGVIDIQNARLNAFSDHDVIALETLTAQIAVAIQNARLYEAAQKELTERKRSQEVLQDSLKELQEAYDQTRFYAQELRQEITERKEAQEALQSSEERFRQVVASLSAHVYVTEITADKQRLNLYLSPNVEALTGYSLQQFVSDWGFWPSTVIHPEDRTLAAEQAARLANGQSSEEEYRLIRADGRIIWIRDSARVHHQNGSKIVYGLVSDITDSKQAQQEIQSLNEELEQRVIDRTRELMALYEVTAVGSEALNLETMLAQTLDRVLAAMQSQEGLVHLLDQAHQILRLAAHRGIPAEVAGELDLLPLNDSLEGWIVQHVEALLVKDMAAPGQDGLPIRYPRADCTFVGAPMRVGGQVIGVLGVVRGIDRQFGVEEVALLTSIADQIGVMVENARLRRQAEQTAIIKERERLARELHDSVTQSLYSLTLLAGGGQRFARAGALENPDDYFKDLGEIAQQALKEMRLLVHELRPAILEQEGLVGALQQRLDSVERRAGVETRLLVDDHSLKLPPAVEEDLYRIAQEALNNALKHTAASLVTVRIQVESGQLVLEITDNGHGFESDIPADSGGIGLVSIRERVQRLGGKLQLRSTPAAGTSLKVTIDTAPQTTRV